MFDSTALEFGLINTLYTGDGLTDTLVCVLVPTLVQRLRYLYLQDQYRQSAGPSRAYATTWRKRLREWLFGRCEAVHTIEYKALSMGPHRTVPEDDKNVMRSFLLQKAFAVFLAHHLDTRQLVQGRYELVQAANDSPTAQALALANNEVGLLAVGSMPPLGVWVALENGIEVMHEETRFDPTLRSSLQVERTMFHLRSRHPGGTKRVHALIQKAYDEFQAIQNKNDGHDGNRYIYMATFNDNSHGDGGDGEQGSSSKSGTARPCKRYALGDDKTFDSVFFDEKEQLLQLLTDFHHRRGKFSVDGFPYKLGLLLHGPPGTGKTSIIKAIAQMTGRHIVTIPLSKIKTNQELMQAMFDLQFQVPDIEMPVRLKFRDVVFVMEDIDCAADIVAARSASPTLPSESDAPLQLTRTEKLMAQLLQTQRQGKTGIISGVQSLQTDKLTLSGLLNVLDGVVDCPGRIVIMSTNHPEKLDPALIRPGRVNKKLFLGPMSGTCMQQLLEYFFGTQLSSSQEQTLSRVTKSFTPAQVEAFCAEFEDIDAILAHMTE